MAYGVGGKRRNIRYSEFRQATRRHAPSELISAVATAASLQTYEKDVAKWAKGIPSWAYAAMARDCLLYSDEVRHKKVDDRAMRWMRNIFTEVHEPDDGRIPDIFAMVSGYVYEQSFYQKDELNEMARSYLLYTQTEVPDRYQSPRNKIGRIISDSRSTRPSPLLSCWAQ